MLVVHTTLVLFNVVVLTTVFVVVTVGVGTLDVLVLLTRTVETCSVIVSRSVFRTTFCIVSVVPSGVKVDLTVTVESLLMVTVFVGKTVVKVTISRDVVVLCIVWAGRVVVEVLTKVLVLSVLIVTAGSVDVQLSIPEIKFLIQFERFVSDIIDQLFAHTPLTRIKILFPPHKSLSLLQSFPQSARMSKFPSPRIPNCWSPLPAKTPLQPRSLGTPSL